LSDEEQFIRDWIADVVAEKEACADEARKEVLWQRECKLGSLLPPATGVLNLG